MNQNARNRRGAAALAFVLCAPALAGAAPDTGLFPKSSSQKQEPHATARGKEVSLTLSQAVRSALAHNPNVTQLRLDTEIAEAEIERQRGLFSPVLTASALQRSEGVYTANVVVGDNRGVATTYTTQLKTALTGRTTYGGTYTFSVEGQRIGNFSLFSTLIPLYQTGVAARYVQPLLRGAGPTPNKGLIERAKYAEEATRLQSYDQRLELALEVVRAYWSLVVRRQEVKIREASLSEVHDVRELVERRIRGGQAPRSDLIHADVTVAERQQVVRQAQLAVIAAEELLLSLTYLNRAGGFSWENVLVPTDQPTELPERIDFEQALAVALRERPEIERVRRDLARARLDHSIAKNNSRLRLDVYAEAGVFGLAGTPLPSTMNPPLVVGGLGKALANMASAEAPYFEVGLQMELPLGNGVRESEERQAKLRVDRVLAEDVKTEISLEVRAAMQRLDIAASRLAGARAAEKLATQNVDAQKKRYEGGAATVFDTLRVQDELARLQGEVALAAAEQEFALAQLFAAQGTLFKHFGIENVN